MIWLILVASILNFLLGLFVIIKHRSGRANIIFGILGFIASLWCFNNFMTGISSNPAFWLKGAYAWGSLVAATGLVWSLVLTNASNVKIKSFIAYFFAILFFISSYIDGLIIGKIDVVLVGRFEGETGPFFFLYSIFFISVVFTLIFTLYTACRKSKDIKRSQLFLALLGVIFYTSISILVSFVLPLFGYNELMAMDSPSSLFFVGAIAYAITRYRLMGIKIIVSKIYIYVALAAFSYLFFHFVYQIDLRFFDGVYDGPALIAGIFFAIIFAAIFLPLLNYIQRSSDVLFFKGYNPRRIIKDLTIELRGVIKINEIFKILQKNFKRVLGTEELRILIFENGNKKTKSCISKKYSFNLLDLKKDDRLCICIHENKSLIIRDEIKQKSLQKELDNIKAKIIAPLITQDKVFGAIILGEKISQSAYTQEDIEFLEIISTQAAVAIQNALLYEEVSELNKNLEKKVAEQTRDLTKKANHLKKLLAMRSEFLDITSHQLRTPVSVIKGMISMILDGSIKDKNKMHEFLRACFKKANKLSDIINDILRASEMDTEKFILDLSPVDISSILKEIVEDKKVEAKEKGIKLSLSLPNKKLPQIMSNEPYIKQAIINLINNSLQYTKRGYIKVQAELDKKYVLVRVSDTGIGIPKKDQKKLFTKFGRAQNAVETFTDGSGLGLFIDKKIIEGHKDADIYIEKSELGKGTTFVIKLPIAKQALKSKIN